MADLAYIGTASPLGSVCSGKAALAQRIMALLFASRGPLRFTAGNGMDVLYQASSVPETARQLLQIGISDIIDTINADSTSPVSVEISGISAEGDRIRLDLAITTEGGTDTTSITLTGASDGH